MADCIFCKIVKKEMPSFKVFEDDKILAFLDIKPVNPGHVLVVPKEHYHWMQDTTDDLVSQIFVKSKELMKAIQKAVACDFVVVSVVGIDVPHFHVHLIPRYLDDDMANFWPQGVYGEGEGDDVAKKIKAELK
jgi:histidine triad (HIT) family protein